MRIAINPYRNFKHHFSYTQKKNGQPNRRVSALFVLLLTVVAASGCTLGVQQAVELPGSERTAIPTRPTAETLPMTATAQVSLPVDSDQTATALVLDAAFNGERALADLAHQVQLGPRPVGSPAHLATGDWIAAQLAQAGWEVEIQESEYMGKPVRNIVGKWGAGEPWIVLGAHYDTRLIADKDLNPQMIDQPVLGANDGASGVAVLLELARSLPGQLAGAQEAAAPLTTAEQIWLVFFDTEDNGAIEGWDWILGSRAFVRDLRQYPTAAVIIDMIGDKELNVYFEGNSHPGISQEIWSAAAALGYADFFIPTVKFTMLDDHTPFKEAGIPAVDIIDFDYPYHHTTGDTLDKVSARSLQTIGETLIAWLRRGSAHFRSP